MAISAVPEQISGVHSTMIGNENGPASDVCASDGTPGLTTQGVAMTDRKPQRIQRRRTPGWRMPEGAVYVGRPTVFGNPFEVIRLSCGCWENRDDNDVTYMHSYPIHEDGHPPITKREAVENSVRLFAADLTDWLGGRIENQPGLAESIAGLRGKHLACWCPLDQPCHADVLLMVANGEAL